MTLYTVEDSFIWQMLEAEVDYLTEQYQVTNQWPVPRKSHYKLYHSVDDLPDIIKFKLLKAPKQTEFYGEDGNHYHLYRFEQHENTILVAEVSDKLVVRKIKQFIFIALLVVTLLISFFAIFIAFRLAKRTLSPLTKLSKMFDQARPSELPKDFSDQFPNNEIGVLATALDNAAKRTDEFVERELQFTRDASHELRTPIAIVAGATELLKKSHDLTEIDTETVSRIEEANLNMSQTVQTLLALAREEENNEHIDPTLVLPILEKVVVRAAYLIANKNIEVDIKVARSFSIKVSSNVLDIVLWNLISNAFQYTQQGSVSVYLEGSKLVISDTGIGIDKELQDRICESSVKGANSQGFGIGLSIVKRLCEKQNLALEIENLQQGTRVSIY